MCTQGAACVWRTYIRGWLSWSEHKRVNENKIHSYAVQNNLMDAFRRRNGGLKYFCHIKWNRASPQCGIRSEQIGQLFKWAFLHEKHNSSGSFLEDSKYVIKFHVPSLELPRIVNKEYEVTDPPIKLYKIGKNTFAFKFVLPIVHT